MSSGISTTFTELKRNGIIVTDDGDSFSGSSVSQSEMVQLTNILDDKIDDLMEGSEAFAGRNVLARRHAGREGDPRHPVVHPDSPTTGTTFGIDRAANSFWRNRASSFHRLLDGGESEPRSTRSKRNFASFAGT